MKNFYLKTLFFLSILFILLALIKSTMPFYWGDKILTEKIEYLLNSDQKYNTVLVGSSQVQRHIDPRLFDKVNNANKKSNKIPDTRTFNMGRGGTFFLESYYLTEQLLADERAKEIENVLVHTSGVIMPIHDRNVSTIRTLYYMDWKRYKIGVKYFYIKKDWHQIYNHTISFIANKFCVGVLRHFIEFHMDTIENRLPDDYMSYLDWHSGHSPYGHQPNRKKRFRVDKYPQPLKGVCGTIYPQDTLLIESFGTFKNELEQKNVNLYNIVPPNTDYYLKDPNINSLYLGDSDTFKEFWDIKYRFNTTHMDNVGAEMYTRKLARKFRATKNLQEKQRIRTKVRKYKEEKRQENQKERQQKRLQKKKQKKSK